jgi:hypothetical protein
LHNRLREQRRPRLPGPFRAHAANDEDAEAGAVATRDARALRRLPRFQSLRRRSNARQSRAQSPLSVRMFPKILRNPGRANQNPSVFSNQQRLFRRFSCARARVIRRFPRV